MRHPFLLALLLLTATSPMAAANDATALNVLGFSPDGRFFAFEEYGESDASGMTYAYVRTIDVAANVFVKGKQIKSEDPNDDDIKGVAYRRADAMAKATTLLKPLKISRQNMLTVTVDSARPGEILMGSDILPLHENPLTGLALPEDWFGPDAKLTIASFSTKTRCFKDEGDDRTPAGLVLTLERKSKRTELNRDRNVPKSRGCVNAYGIAEVHALRLPGGQMALAAVLQYFAQGFEGPDRRFIAVTAKIPKP